MLHFLYSKTENIHSKLFCPKDEHRVTQTRVTPHTAARPQGGGGAASHTTHSQGAPGLFSVGHEDTVTLEVSQEGLSHSHPL